MTAGRPAIADHRQLAEQIRALRSSGLSYREIAAKLNAAGVPTLRGGRRWRPSSLQTIVGYTRPPEGIGLSTKPTYRSWKAMLSRCTDQRNMSWDYYGGAGVTICAEWQVFETFVADMGERLPGTSLDRIDPDGNYEPGNCRWATATEQAINKRDEERQRRLLIGDWIARSAA